MKDIDIAMPLARVREQGPLTMCITNFVTVNDCANIILAAGGYPSMPHIAAEVEESVEGSAALVCNMGAIEDTEAMILAGRRANVLGKPVVLDPVAVGGTKLRRDAAERLLAEVRFSAIRGNASEIFYLAGRSGKHSGVDVSVLDKVTEDNIRDAVGTAKELAKKTGAVIAVSGAIDIVTDGERTAVIRNGRPVMAKITGSGCMVTSLIGSFCAAVPDDCFTAVCSAMTVMGVCGEAADDRRLANGTGNATFRNDLIDAVFCLTEEDLRRAARVEVL